MRRQSRGVCKRCYAEFRLTEDRVPEHNWYGGIECAGSNTIALDDETTQQRRTIDLIARTMDFANTSHMSEKNRLRCGRAVYYTLREAGLIA